MPWLAVAAAMRSISVKPPQYLMSGITTSSSFGLPNRWKAAKPTWVSAPASRVPYSFANALSRPSTIRHRMSASSRRIVGSGRDCGKSEQIFLSPQISKGAEGLVRPKV